MKSFARSLNGFLFIFVVAVTACSAQITKEQNRHTSPANKNTLDVSFCDGCEVMYVGMPKDIKPTRYSPA